MTSCSLKSVFNRSLEKQFRILGKYVLGGIICFIDPLMQIEYLLYAET